VLVLELLLDEFDGGAVGAVVVVFVLVVVLSLVFSVVAAGFTTVVLFSVFFSAGAAGATVSVFCSHAPRRAALAKMQISFFIVVDWLPILGLRLNRNGLTFRSCES
jgi:hypothetical protein